MMTPRQYLSWSALNLWETSPAKYIKMYVHGEKMYESKELRFGKKVADSLEQKVPTGEVATDGVLAKIPKLELADHMFRTAILVENVAIPLLGKFDSAAKDLSGLLEYKTGKAPWTQRMADESGQLTFYAMMITAMKGTPPAYMELIWIPTQNSESGIEVKGNFVGFQTSRSVADVLRMKIRCLKAWQGIHKMWEDFLF